MDIRNSPSKEIVRAATQQLMANAPDAALNKLDGLGKVTTMAVDGKVLKVQHNISVRGSESRDTSKPTRVYRDHLGRLTTEPIGKAEVGLIIWGGTNGRLCHVGFFE